MHFSQASSWLPFTIGQCADRAMVSNQLPRWPDQGAGVPGLQLALCTATGSHLYVGLLPGNLCPPDRLPGVLLEDAAVAPRQDVQTLGIPVQPKAGLR